VIGLLWAFAPFAELGGAIFNQPRLLSSPIADTIGAVTVALAGLGVYWMFLGAACDPRFSDPSPSPFSHEHAVAAPIAPASVRLCASRRLRLQFPSCARAAVAVHGRTGPRREITRFERD
jgi:hypothetical protein